MEQKTPLLCVIIALILCIAGLLCWKRDLFARFHHPLREKYPHISKYFGTVLICFSLFWLAFMIILLVFDTH